jgi:signal transduction histidine kinase
VNDRRILFTMTLRRFAQMAALAVIYLIVARAGLLFDAESGFATLVWPPTGIAIAVLLIAGLWMWPAILISAFAVNVWTGAPIAVAAGIAIGNTLEALIAVSILRRWPRFDSSLADVHSVGGLVTVAIVATTTSATVGVASLFAGCVIASAQLVETWRAWWVGDALGALVIAPLLLTWRLVSPARSLRSLEALAVGVLLIGISLLVFGPTLAAVSPFQQVYAVIPILTWIAVRFGPRGAATASFAVAAIAIAATSLSVGPFARETLRGGLMALQVYIGFIAATFIVVAALASERARAARDAEQRRHELEIALQSMQVAREHAEHASGVKTDFLRMVSHELRTPLATLLLQIERLNLEPDVDRRKLVSSMNAQGQRLHHLIDGLLEFARIQSGRLELHVESADPCGLVSECADELRPLAETNHLGLDLETTAAPARFATDQRLLRLIVMNLAHNALKFTAKGKVTIVLGGDVRELRITVRDTGRGIPPADQQRVFEPFEHLDPVRSKHLPGVGLGLALVHAIVTALGGMISLESAVGHGSSFSVTLPSGSDG